MPNITWVPDKRCKKPFVFIDKLGFLADKSLSYFLLFFLKKNLEFKNQLSNQLLNC